jgi:hypothetical protein
VTECALESVRTFRNGVPVRTHSRKRGTADGPTLGDMGSNEPVCPACGQPVEMVVRRHKTLGAWVPTWVHGPCGNRECERCPDHDAVAGPPTGPLRTEPAENTDPTPEPGPRSTP